MGLLHRGPGVRLAKLERLARDRPCSGCGRASALQRGVRALPELDRLDAAEQEELALLLGVASTGPCGRCGRSGHDIARLSDEQKHRTLALLRVVLGPTGVRT